jgi:hypothetical protein
MLHRKLYQFCAEQRPVWVFLRDQQRWIEEYVCRSGSADDVITSEDCPEAERLSNP